MAFDDVTEKRQDDISSKLPTHVVSVSSPRVRGGEATNQAVSGSACNTR